MEQGCGSETAARWDARYAEDPDGFFFGREPSVLAQLAVRYWRLANGDCRGHAIDLGCGEGRDAVYLATVGFDVTAVDVSSVGLAKLERLAADAGVTVRATLCDVLAVDLSAGYSLMLAGNSLSILGDGCPAFLARMRRATPQGGFHAVRTATNVGAALPENPDMHRMRRGELKRMYRRWQLYYCGEDLMHVPHTGLMHSFADIVARKP